MIDGDNRHPADELAEVRASVKRLKDREVALRSEILDMSKAEREGRSYHARVVVRARRRLNLEMLEDEIGDLERFYEKEAFTMVYVEKLK